MSWNSSTPLRVHHRGLAKLAVATGVLAFALACSSGDGGSASAPDPSAAGAGGTATSGDFLGSCDTRNENGQCRDWLGTSNADLEVSCDYISGTFSATEPCSKAARVASCALGEVLEASATYRYYEPDYDTAAAEEHCDGLGGTFTSAGGDGGAAGSGGSGGDGGAAGSGGKATGGSNTGGSSSCPPECFRPYQCVRACGDEPIDFGCCPCPSDMIDTLNCP